MPGKGLGALLALLLAAALLSGCGGGGEESGPGQSTASSPATSTEPNPPTAAVQKLRQDSERVRAERKQTEQSPSEAPQAPEEGSQGAQGTAHPLPPARPNNTHHDSGGGSSQFTRKGGDNSIQESGTEAGEAELQAAAAVLHAYLDARVAHRWDEACFYLSASAVTLLERFAERFGKDKGITSCPEVLEALGEGSSPGVLEETAKADAGSLRVDGDHGFLLYRGARGEAYAIPMVSEGGAWKVGAVDGTAGI